MSKTFVAFTQAGNDLREVQKLNLPCPRTGDLTTCLYDDSSKRLYDLQTVKGPGRKCCWLINDAFIQDGTIHYITPMDPLYIALPILERGRNSSNESEGRFRMLDDLLSNENEQASDIGRLEKVDQFVAQLDHLCEKKEIAKDMYAYRLDDKKALAWLQKKVEHLVQRLPQIAPPSTFTDDPKDKEELDKCYKQEAIYLLAKYLSHSWFLKLLDSYGLEQIKDEADKSEISSYFDNDPQVYMRSNMSKENVEIPTKKAKTGPAVPRSLAKVNTKGMRTLASMWGGKK
ncbi:ribonuclease H2, subunit B [Syncephalastrum racemosum]|uniref:Ribonuclease H2 subunit B n=1 Tax=Syncephalastrum racemosum TaxID=13706 RepID=A0A1X2HLM1_SYNRA|nr:ribonuclease H2, subunit B [Syncephalastrum racemosum]